MAIEIKYNMKQTYKRYLIWDTRLPEKPVDDASYLSDANDIVYDLIKEELWDEYRIEVKDINQNSEEYKEVERNYLVFDRLAKSRVYRSDGEIIPRAITVKEFIEEAEPKYAKLLGNGTYEIEVEFRNVIFSQKTNNEDIFDDKNKWVDFVAHSLSFNGTDIEVIDEE